jgi:hypothetical protein
MKNFFLGGGANVMGECPLKRLPVEGRIVFKWIIEKYV